MTDTPAQDAQERRVQASQSRGSGKIWAFVPVIVIGLAMIPNAIMIAVAKQRAPASVEESPYAASVRIDDEKSALKRFDSMGFALTSRVPEAGMLQLELDGPQPLEGVEVLLQRHDTATLDKVINWDSIHEPLAVAVPRLGRWTVTLTGSTPGGDPVQARTWEMVR